MPYDAGWARARRVLERIIAPAGDRRADAVGRVRYVGSGLSYRVYGATVALPDGSEQDLVVKLPQAAAPGGSDDRTRRENRILEQLRRLVLPFDVPRPVATVDIPEGVAAVQEWVAGLPADLRAGRSPGGPPGELVGRIAAAIHAVDPEPFRGWLWGHPTRRAHVLGFGHLLDELGGADAAEAWDWITRHLAAPEPSRLLHGDLLGQNLLLSLQDGRIAVLDWGDARLGDPAYDLAIVTRGVRRPFQDPDGLQRLIDSYNQFAPQPLTIADVRVHEILLRTKLYLDVRREHGVASAHAESELQRLRSLITRTLRECG